MQSLVADNLQEASAYAVNTIFKAFTIAFGIMIVSAVFRFIGKIKIKPPDH
jgi:hypothetical protein